MSKMRVSEVHAAELVAYLNSAFVRLQDIWEDIGIPDSQRVLRTKDVHKHIKGLLDLMISEEEEIKPRLLKEIEAGRKVIFALCDELDVPHFEEEESATILQMANNCSTWLEVMREHKKQRMEDLKELLLKDRKLCDVMCCPPFIIDNTTAPSLKKLNEFRAYLEEQKEEKERRFIEFVSIRKELITLMEELEQVAETSFETDLVCEDEDGFCLSNDNMSAVKLLQNTLKERKAEIEHRCSSFRTKIQELWERLQIPQEDRDAFSEHMSKSKKKNVEALQAEVERLELLKMQYRFTEELLIQHEAEVNVLKTYYQDHTTLFEGVTKWQNSWTLFLELDMKANDPSRFNNRGGNLLKEEKQRSDLHKSLRKLEKSLKIQIDSWEQEEGREFFVNGQKFLDYVQQQWDQHHAEKEKEKLERQLKKTKQTQAEMLYGSTARTPSKRRLAATPTPGKVRKFTGISTLSTPNSFMNSGLSGNLCQSVQKPPMSAGKVNGLRNPGQLRTPNALRNKENLPHFRNTPSGTLRSQDNQDCTFTFNSLAASYSEFARDLTKASKTNVKTGLLNSTVDQQ